MPHDLNHGGLSDADRLARSRLLVLTLVRLAGVVLMFFGLVIAATDLVADGGAPGIGLPVAFVGLLESLLLPKLFAGRWRTRDGSEG